MRYPVNKLTYLTFGRRLYVERFESCYWLNKTCIAGKAALKHYNAATQMAGPTVTFV